MKQNWVGWKKIEKSGFFYHSSSKKWKLQKINLFFSWKTFLHNRTRINLKNFFSCSNVSRLLYLIIFDSENLKKKRRPNFVSFSGLEKSETKLKNQTKLSGNSIPRNLWCIASPESLGSYHQPFSSLYRVKECLLEKTRHCKNASFKNFSNLRFEFLKIFRELKLCHELTPYLAGIRFSFRSKTQFWWRREIIWKWRFGVARAMSMPSVGTSGAWLTRARAASTTPRAGPTPLAAIPREIVKFKSSPTALINLE